MLQLRRFDEASRREYLDEVRPRLVVLRVRADKVRITWGVPLWAAEEVAGFLLGAAALLNAALPLAPLAWRRRLAQGITVRGRQLKLEHVVARPNEGASALELFRTIDALAGGSLRDVLRVPAGEPYVNVRTGDTHIEIAAL